MSFRISTTTLSADLAASGTVALSYPTGTDEDTFTAYGHKAVALGNFMNSPDDFTITLNSASFVFTYAAGKTTLPAGTVLDVQLNLRGPDNKLARVEPVDDPHLVEMKVIRADLGSPLTLDADGIAAAQAVAGAGNLTINGALASGGAVNVQTGAGGAPFGRGVQIVSSNAGDTTQTATFTGTDWQGNAVTEQLTFNGVTPVLGAKTFATVTQVAISAALTGNGSAGTTDVLGLPFYVDSVDQVLLELQDHVAAVAGTFAAGVDAAATATTGDVRGTYDPNAATNGAINFVVVMAVADPNYQGVTQA